MKKIMTIVFILLGFLLCGSAKEQHYILDKVAAEYFVEPAMAEIFRAAQRVDAKQNEIDAMSVQEALLTDSDSKACAYRMKILRQYFIEKGDLAKTATDDEVREQVLLTLAQIVYPSCTTSVEMSTRAFILDYVQREKNNLLIEYQAMGSKSPEIDFSTELANRLKGLQALLEPDSWKQYAVDLQALAQAPEEVALISRNGQDLFFRGNIYIISGMAGTMKSYLCLTIAAAAINGGMDVDRTLSFCSISEPLKVLYADTELAINTIRKRWGALAAMTREHFNPDRFKYISLRKVPGSVEDKKRIFDDACRKFAPDVIIVDSGRDLCLDFNDNRESDALVSYFLQISSDLNSILISTSHQSLSAGNAKGHLGMRFNEKAGLELSLAKKTGLAGNFIVVKYPKEREDTYNPFSFTFDPETQLLKEYDLLADCTEDSRQFKSAKAALETVLSPGDVVSHSTLVSRLCGKISGPTGGLISNKTAKNYISAALGRVISQNGDGKYSLIGEGPAISFPADEEDMPEYLFSSLA